MVWQRPPRARQELKYIIDLQTADRFIAAVEGHCKPDPHAGPGGVYEVASLYFDTRDLRFYWDRQESVGYRRKVRVRSYNADGRSVGLFLEIKEKHKALVAKKRSPIKDIAGVKLSPRHDRTPLRSFIDEAANDVARGEVEYLASAFELLPISIVRYVRKTLMGVAERDLRITFDERITAGGADLFRYNAAREKFVYPSGLGVLEIKADAQLPLWLIDILSEFQLVQSRFSKYCLSVEAMYGDKPGVLYEDNSEAADLDEAEPAHSVISA